MMFTFTGPGRLESDDGYAIVRVNGSGHTLGWEIFHRAERLGPPWTTGPGYSPSLRDARHRAEAHQRFMRTKEGSPGQ
jgi:hypothetical protein